MLKRVGVQKLRAVWGPGGVMGQLSDRWTRGGWGSLPHRLKTNSILIWYGEQISSILFHRNCRIFLLIWNWHVCFAHTTSVYQLRGIQDRKLGEGIWYTFNKLYTTYLIALKSPGSSVGRALEVETCDWKVAGLNPGLNGPMGLHAFPYFLLCVPSLSFGRDTKPRSRVNRLTVPAR